MSTWKKVYVIVFAILLLALLGAMVTVTISSLRSGETPEEVGAYLQRELELPEETAVSYVATFSLEDRSLLWFSGERAHGRTYWAAECTAKNQGGYQVEKIWEPMVYAPDIVHLLWQGADVFLVCDQNCSGILYRDSQDNVISQVDLTPGELPYLFQAEELPEGGKLDFLGKDGQIIP